jgi:hypothetical protein
MPKAKSRSRVARESREEVIGTVLLKIKGLCPHPKLRVRKIKEEEVLKQEIEQG